MSKILYTLYGFYSIRSFWSVVFLVIGIILMIRWKKKNKSRRSPQLWIGAILAAASVVVLAAGCFNILLKPQFEHIKLSEQELTSFTEYLLEDERFLQKDKFMPNNETNYKEEDEEEKCIGQYIMYQPGSTVGYYLFTYDSSEEAKAAFIEKMGYYEYGPYQMGYEEFSPFSGNENAVYIENDTYTIYVPPVENKYTFFNLEQGDHSSTAVDIYILYDNYIIKYYEDTERSRPVIYRLIKDELFFDSQYKLPKW